MRRTAAAGASAPIHAGQVLHTHTGIALRVLSTDTFTVFGNGRRIGPLLCARHVNPVAAHTLALPLADAGRVFRLPGQQLALFHDHDAEECAA